MDTWCGYDSHNIRGAKGRRPLHFQQQCVGCHITLVVLHRNKCQHKCRFNPWTHIYKADNHQKWALSLIHIHTKQHTHNHFFKLLHTKPVNPLSPRSQCSWGVSLFGRLRPTHPYYDTSNLFYSCWVWLWWKREVEQAKPVAWDKFVMCEEGRKEGDREIIEETESYKISKTHLR